MLKDEMIRMILIILPIVAIYIFTVVTLVHIVRNQKYKVGTMGVWILITLMIPLAGPILYMRMGKYKKEK